MALIFIAFFGLVTEAILHIADAVELQQGRVEAAASADAEITGAALLAVRTVQETGCNPGASGSLTMHKTQDTITYQTTACPPPPSGSPNGCVLSTDRVVASDRRGAVLGTATVLVEANCSGGAKFGIVSFEHGP
jgi:hypothetical protein